MMLQASAKSPKNGRKTFTKLKGLGAAIGLASGLTIASPAAAETAGDYTQALTDNLRYSFDISSRASYFDERDELGFMHAVGVDLHKVVSGDYGDIGTLLVQGYITRIDNLPVRPGFFDDAHDTEFVYRIVNFNYTGWGGRSGIRAVLPNVRVGHFEIPFGLEHTINTNGTLRDYLSGRNLGLKADWGAALNDEVGNFEYEFSYSSAGGQEFSSENGSYAMAGRVGTLRENDTVVGIAVYKAKLKNGSERERVGVDLQHYFGLHAVFAEVSTGENGSMDVLNSQLEWNVRNSKETWTTYVRAIRFSQDMPSGWEENTSGIIGALYTPDASWSFSGQVTNDFSHFPGAIHETRIDMQIRYRFH